MSIMYRLGSLIAIFGGWYIIADGVEAIDPANLPALTDVVYELILMFKEGSIYRDIQETFVRWIIGFAGGVGLGMSIGFILASYTKLYRFVELPIELIRSIPMTALLPLFFLLFGIGNVGKVAMIIVPTCLLMIIHTHHGASSPDAERLRMAKLFGSSKWHIFRRITWYETLPHIFIGLRMALSFSLIMSIIVEMFIGTNWGLGQRIYDSYLKNAPTFLYAYLLIIGFYGYAINAIFIKLEKAVITWQGEQQ